MGVGTSQVLFTFQLAARPMDTSSHFGRGLSVAVPRVLYDLQGSSAGVQIVGFVANTFVPAGTPPPRGCSHQSAQHHARARSRMYRD